MDDWRLIRQYLDEGSETAFGRLVDRHIKMVYWACRRDLGNDQLAEDATQAVFLYLARNARQFKPESSVAGWLFTTARNAARTAQRGETRRRHYEEEAAKAMQETSARAPSWEAVEPWLNDGLSQLSAGDRELVLLRYVEGASLAEVARAVGIAEPAARKRVSRAVDRLRQHLARREATVTSAVLLAMLAEHSAKAAPAGCQAAVLQALKTNAPAPMPTLHPLNPILGKGLLIVSTTKIAVAGVSVIIVLAALSFAIVHKLHSPPPTTIWQAPVAADPATQTAQQQIQAELGHFVHGMVTSNPSEPIAALSPDLVMTQPGLPPENYQEMVKDMQTPHFKFPPDASATFKINSCSIQGNTAVVGADLLAHGTSQRVSEHKNGGQDVRIETDNDSDIVCNVTLTNTSGRWLISRIEVLSDRETPYRRLRTVNGRAS